MSDSRRGSTRACVGLAMAAVLACSLPVVCQGGDLDDERRLTLYGALDVSVNRLDDGRSMASVLGAGVGRASHLGVRFRERLGPGFAVTGLIEYGLRIDTARLDPRPDITLNPPDLPTDRCASAPHDFRRTVIGVHSPLGDLLAGRDFTPSIELLGAIDLFQFGGWGALSESSLTIRAFECNALRYRSPSWSGVRLNAMGAFDEQPGIGRRSGPGFASWDTSLVYRAGPVVVGLARRHEPLRSSARDTADADPARRSTIIGIQGAFGRLVGTLPLIFARDDLGRHIRISGVGISARLQAGRLGVQLVSHRTDGLGSARVYGARYSYPMSRRLSAYLSIGIVENRGSAIAVPLAADGAFVFPAAAGATAKAFGLGLSYRFDAHLGSDMR